MIYYVDSLQSQNHYSYKSALGASEQIQSTNKCDQL